MRRRVDTIPGFLWRMLLRYGLLLLGLFLLIFESRDVQYLGSALAAVGLVLVVESVLHHIDKTIAEAGRQNDGE